MWDGVLLDAPDQAVVHVSPDHPISMGLTILNPKSQDSGSHLNQIVAGLRSIGREPSRGQHLREFTLDRIEDLQSRRVIQSAAQAEYVPIDHLWKQIGLLIPQTTISVRFLTPLRCSRPKSKREEGHQFLDDLYFPSHLFLQRLQKRLFDLGWNARESPPLRLDNQEENQMAKGPSDSRLAPPILQRDDERSALSQLIELDWLDVGYGGKEKRKTLGGVVGLVRLTKLEVVHKAALILGQYLRVGENTRFGFGAYRILECEDLSPHCPRTESLLSRSLSTGDLNSVGEQMQLDSGVLMSSVLSIEEGKYRPDPPFRIEISKPTGGTRTLSIPSKRDRAVARLLLQEIQETIDAFLESSSMAYRRGLGRHQAARRLRHLYRQGYHWAVRADFERFFDNLDHSLLRRRLFAYLADEPLVDFLMVSVQSGSTEEKKGIPTGSPLSPLLANLFLDRFDEAIEDSDAKLIRYSDDFMILCKSRERAEALFEAARLEAESLRLQLNQAKTGTVHLPEGFCFLGFHFDVEQDWELGPPPGPQLVEDLGWKPVKPVVDRKSVMSLPGEGRSDRALVGQSLILGPSVQRVSLDGKNLVIEKAASPRSQRVALPSVREITLIGEGAIDWTVVKIAALQGTTIQVLSNSMRPVLSIAGDSRIPDAKGVASQVRLQESQQRCLSISRWLIASKINNYAILATSTWNRKEGGIRELYELALNALNAKDFPELFGYEGRAARLWYGRLQELISSDFTFEVRVAPDATDPINSLLNWGQTILHRWLVDCIEHAGLIPTIGVMHRDRAGHSTLASDLQEPFRHLADRAVIEATKNIRAADFMEDLDGPHTLSIKPKARSKFLEILHGILSLNVTGYAQSEPFSYLHQGKILAKGCRRAILDESQSCTSFWHPSPITELAWRTV